MKKTTLMLLTILTIFGILFAGCSNDDNGMNSISTDLLETTSSQKNIHSIPNASGSDDDGDMRIYRVTIQNMSHGQPLAPPVIATHVKGFTMFQKGKLASRGLEAIAENGDVSLMFNRYNNSTSATEAVNIGMPLTRKGTSVGGFMDKVTFEISGKKHDRLSIAAMLICTNDGFTGLNSVELPEDGKKVYYMKSYDAGTEENTERSVDIVDGCSALGAVALVGDPNGNENDAVDSSPHQRIRKHRGTKGNGDLDQMAHMIEKKIAKVTIEIISGGDHDDDDQDDDDHDDD